MNKKGLINYLIAEDGRNGRTWLSLATQFNIEPKNKERYKDNLFGYENAKAKAACDIWRAWLKKNPRNLELVKISTRNGQVVTETYKKKVQANAQGEYNKDDFDIIQVTELAHGGANIKRILKAKDTVVSIEERIDAITDKVAQSIQEATGTHSPPFKNKFSIANDKPSLVICLSDRHFGALTKKDSDYKNEWNKEEYKKRHGDILNYIYNLVNTTILEEIVFFDLGDSVDGWNKKTTRNSPHTLPQNLNNIEQYESFVEETTKLLTHCSLLKKDNLVNRVRYVGTYNSNHGGDFEALCMLTVEKLSKFMDYDCEVHGKFINNTFVKGRPYIFLHGKDYEDLKHGFPLNLNERTYIQIKEYIEAYGLAHYGFDPIVIKGDWHQHNYERTRSFSYENCPSMYGSSKWMHSNFGPGFAATGVHLLYPYGEPYRHLIFHSKDSKNEK